MQRLEQLHFGEKTLLLPCFFPSVSSVKTNLTPLQYVQLLSGLEYPQFLLSAYDYENAGPERNALAEYVMQAQRQNCTILLDSGNYESFWRHDKSWDADHFRRACRRLNPDISFCFDEQDPPEDRELAASAAISRIEGDMQALPEQIVLPIVHGTSNNLPWLVADVVRKVRPKLVVIAERELGQGIAERCRTLAAIRSRLNEMDSYWPIHLLGTGNPFSILAFALSGADSFDGLEWCQTVVEFASGQLSHFQHWDLYASTSPLANSGELPYQQKTLAHNLAFWADLMKGVRDYLKSGTPSPLIAEILGRISPALPGHIL